MSADIRVGDARSVLAAMPDASVHCVVTSPPYYGLRAYGGDPGMIGLEETLDEHLDNLVAVFREVRRVLRPDGTLWLNYGDSYARGDKRGSSGPGDKQASNRGSKEARGAKLPAGLKPKDLMGLPWRVAFALQNDGWWLRSDVVWHKANPMPESAKDRPTRAHEFVFLLTPAQRYFYDHEAVKEPVSGTANARAAKERRGSTSGEKVDVRARHVPPSHAGREATSHRSLQDPQYDHRMKVPGVTPKTAPSGSGIRRNESYGAAMVDQPATRNLRDVWTFASAPFKGAHFATFPPALVEPCIKAGTSEKGVCAECGAPWARLLRVDYRKNRPSAGNDPRSRSEDRQAQGSMGGHHGWRGNNLLRETQTTGWSPTCDCKQPAGGAPYPLRPAVVLDPFAGAGTVGLVANRLGRDSVLIEINPDYADMARKRIHDDAPLLTEHAA